MGVREISPFGIRMPPELKRRLMAEAKRNGRSMNNEVIIRLESSFLDPSANYQHLPPPATYLHMNEYERKMLELFKSWSIEKQLSFLIFFNN